MGENDHISTTGVPSRNNASNLDCGFQAVQGPRKQTLQKYLVTNNFVNGLWALTQARQQTNNNNKAISNLVSVLARRGLPLELLLLQVSLGGQEERQDADNAGHANDPVRSGLLREKQ